MSANNNNNNKCIEEPVKEPVVPEKDSTATGIPIHNAVHEHEWASGDRGQWSTGLFECFDDTPNCLDVFCLSPCMLSMQYNAAMYGKSNTMHWPLCMSIVLCDALTHGASAIITQGFPLYFIRKELRDRYHLSNRDGVPDEEGRLVFDEPCDMWWDVMAVLFCTPCAMCQHHREMTARGEWPGKILFGSAPTEHVLVVPGSTMAV